jgi:hypothetical protein
MSLICYIFHKLRTLILINSDRGEGTSASALNDPYMGFQPDYLGGAADPSSSGSSMSALTNNERYLRHLEEEIARSHAQLEKLVRKYPKLSKSKRRSAATPHSEETYVGKGKGKARAE